MAPRDGSNVYHRPPGTDAVPDTTIESTKYNTSVADVEQDLNTPRPIVAGGTGATNPADAQMNLHGDLAYQVVTNFDMQVFVSGSFYCATNTTSAPTTNAFIGVCYTSDPPVVPPALPANANMFLEARDVTTGLKYVRQKVAGVWINSGAWKQQAGSTADLDAAYVNVTGDTMTGPLIIQKDSTPLKWVLASNPAFFGTLTSDPASGHAGVGFLAEKIGSTWQNGPSSLAGAYIASGVSTFGLAAVVNGVATVNAAFTPLIGWGIKPTGELVVPSATFSSSPTTGALTVAGGVGVGGVVTSAAGLVAGTGTLGGNGDIAAGRTATTGYYLFGGGGTKYLGYDGTSYQLVGGGLYVSSNIVTQLTATTGNVYFGNPANGKYLGYDGANFNLAGGGLITGAISATTFASTGVTSYNSSTTGFYLFGQSGTKQLSYDGANFSFAGGGLVAMPLFFVVGGTQRARIDHNGGSWNFFSDGGASNGVYLLPSGTAWTAFSDARQAYKVSAKQIDNVLDRLGGVNLYTNIGPSGLKEVFFKAQELALTLPELVAEGKGARAKDKDYVPTGPGDENGWGVMYDRASCVALQAIKELLARVEVLEAQLAAK